MMKIIEVKYSNYQIEFFIRNIKQIIYMILWLSKNNPLPRFTGGGRETSLPVKRTG